MVTLWLPAACPMAIRVYDPTNGTLIRRFSQNGKGIDVMRQLSNGYLVVASSMYNGAIRVYDPVDGALIRSISQNGLGIQVMDELSNGHIAVAGAGGAIRIFNPDNGMLVCLYTQQEHPVVDRIDLAARLRCISEAEIRKTTYLLAQGARSMGENGCCFFSRLPTALAIKIAVLAGDADVVDEQHAERVGLEAFNAFKRS